MKSYSQSAKSIMVVKKRLLPDPDQTMNQTDPNDLGAALVLVQSIVVDPLDRLWILDTGSQLLQSTKYGGPKFTSCLVYTILIFFVMSKLFPLGLSCMMYFSM
jgi:hypothetical protein